MHVFRGLPIDDRIENDIAIDPAHLGGDDDPADFETDAELLGQRLAELQLESATIAPLAGERQRVGIGADGELAARLDRVERAGSRATGRQRRAGEQCQRDDPPNQRGPAFN